MAVDSDPALSHAPTRDRLDRVRRAALAAVVAGLLATALAVTGLRSEAGSERDLRATLEPATGEVTEVIPAGMLDAGSLRVRVTGRSVVVAADLERESWAPGDPIELLVSPTDPSLVRRADVSGRPGGTALVVVLLAGPVVFLVGVVAAGREARWRRVLEAHPWERVTGTYRQLDGRLLRVELDLDGDRLRVEPTPRWVVEPLRAPGRATFWVSGPAGGYRVVSRPGIPTLVGARPAR